MNLMLRYVSELYFDGKVKYKRYPIYSLERFDGYGVVPGEGRIGARRLCTEGIIGAWYDKEAHVGYAVCHTERSAKLCEFIESAETFNGVVSSVPHGDDTCMIAKGRLYGFLDGSEGTSKMLISTPVETIRFIDPAGQIVQISADDKDKLITMYDLLLMLCKTGHNFLKYQIIRIYNESTKVTSAVKFVDSVEARRFFTKMLLEATSSR